jgi:GH24 family phage-related lysozyme (muramidase)
MSLLKLHDKGHKVKHLQKVLSDKGCEVYPDGIFGRKTEYAVKNFQKTKGLRVDGIVGNKTWKALDRSVVISAPAQPVMGQPGRQNVKILKLSPNGFKMLFKHEAWAGVSHRLHYPGGGSGVTLGPGYDMKLRKESDVIKRLVLIGIDKDIAAKVAKGVGKSGEEANKFCVENKALIKLTQQQEIELLKLTTPSYENQLKNKISVYLTQYEFDALVSFAYNPGKQLDKVCNFINQGNIGDAMALIKRIVYSGKKMMAGLVDRRKHEVDLYLNGKYYQ